MIIDAFTFYNELELLDLRLNYLDSAVDKFILVESDKTHSGQDKPLFYNENREKFKKFKDKIIHVVVDTMPEVPKDNNRWILENYQRNAILVGLEEISPTADDYIIISDMDEIPKAETLLKKHLGVYIQKSYMYYLNVLCAENWNGPVGMTYGTFFSRFKSPQAVRNHRNYVEPIRDGGWHFAWLGGYNRVYDKIKAFAHTEVDKQEYMNVLDVSINNLKPLWAPNAGPMIIEKIDNTYPDYLVNNLEKFKELIYAQA